MTRLRRAIGATTAAVLFAACSGSAETQPVHEGAAVSSVASTAPTSTPDDTFASLAAAVERAGANCLVVSREGRVVGEWLWQDFGSDALQEGFSTTKSVAATLIGIAQDQGKLSIDQPASDFITEWKGTASEGVTIRQLLSNTSGRFHDVVTDYAQLAFLEQDKSTFAVSLGQQHDPGTRWVYNNAAVQTLEVGLERAIGGSVATFAKQFLFDPLGMTSRLSLDGAGNAGLFAGMQTNCRDLAALVGLFMADGEVNGDRILSSAFVDEALAPSSDLNEAYGFLWWLNTRGTVQSSADGSTRSGVSLLGALDEDVFYASGACGQVAMGFPQDKLIVTVMRPVEATSITALAGCGAVNMESVVADAIAPLLEQLRQ